MFPEDGYRCPGPRKHDLLPMIGTTRSLRPRGIGRYFTAAFLSVWLVGWVVGEVFAIGMLATITAALANIFSEHLPAWHTDFVSSGGVAFAILFLVLWLTLWTIGGIAGDHAAHAFARGRGRDWPERVGLRGCSSGGPLPPAFRVRAFRRFVASACVRTIERSWSIRLKVRK